MRAHCVKQIGILGEARDLIFFAITGLTKAECKRRIDSVVSYTDSATNDEDSDSD